MAAQDQVDAMVIRGSGVMLVRPSTPDSGQVTGAGTDIVYSVVVDSEVIFVIDGSASQQEFFSILLDHGVSVEFAKIDKKVFGTDGSLKAAGSSGTGDQINCTIGETDLTAMQDILSYRGKRCRVTVGLGEAGGSVNETTGWASLFGKLSGNISRKTQGETVVTLSLSFTGVEFTASGAGDTAIAAAGSAITPLEGATVTPPAITDMTTLKKGQVVLQASA